MVGSKRAKRAVAICALLLSVICVLAVLSGCGANLTSNAKIESYGRTNQVNGIEGKYDQAYVPDCVPEEEVAFVEFTATADFGTVKAGYYKVYEWEEKEDGSGKVVWEATTYVENSPFVPLEVKALGENKYRVELTGVSKGHYYIRVYGETEQYKKELEKYKTDIDTYIAKLEAYKTNPVGDVPIMPQKSAELQKLEKNNLEVLIKIGGHKNLGKA